MGCNQPSHIELARPRKPAAPRRELLSGLLLSSLVHTTLIVALSLIVLGTDSAQSLNALLLSPSTAVTSSLTELPAFEVTAVAEPAEILMAAPPTREDYLLAANTSVLTPAASPNLVDSGLPESAAPSLASGELTGIAAKAVAGIQGRVVKAGGQPGEVQFALAWRNINDIDLHVIVPSGEHISHMRRRSRCDGLLDVDMNVTGESTEPVENVRWIELAPWGRYTVLINLFRVHLSESGRTSKLTNFQLLAQLGNQTVLREGVIRPSQQVAIFRFHYFPASLPSGQRERLEAELAELQASEEAAATPILNQAKRLKTDRDRDRLLQQIVRTYPHTDAAVEALRLMGGEVVKR